MIDSRDFLAAKRRSETEPMLPAGTRIAFTSGPAYEDHNRIWAALDKVLAKYPDMVLFHGADSDDAGRLFRSDPGHHSDMMPVGQSLIVAV